MRLKSISSKTGATPGAALRIVVTGTMPDRLNGNVAIRSYASDALRFIIPSCIVRDVPLDAAPQAIQRLSPDLVLAIGGVAIDGDGLDGLRRAVDMARAPLAIWLHDDPYEFDYAFRAEAVADVLFTNDSWARVHYRHPRVHHLPLAACRRTHLRAVGSVTKDFELYFCGHAHPNRVAFFAVAAPVLARYAVRVDGTGWPPSVAAASNRRVPATDVADRCAASMLVLNLPREHNVANRRYDLPASTPGPRTFEAALSGSAQLAWSGGLEMADFLEPDKEIVLVDGISSLRRALERGRDDPGAYLAMARDAQRRVLASHCYEHRLAVILERCLNLAPAPADLAEDTTADTSSPIQLEGGACAPGGRPHPSARARSRIGIGADA